MTTDRKPSDPIDPDAVLVAEDDTCATLTSSMKTKITPLSSGAVLEVLSFDPASREGVPAWCRLTGHTLLEAIALDDQKTRFLVRKK